MKNKIKKILIFSFLLLMLLPTLAICLINVKADSASFDGTTNLAINSSLWNKGSFTSAKNCTIDETNGITFDEYGAGSACAAVALKDLLPMYNKIEIAFNSECTDGNAFLKIVFADCSTVANGSALKSWEISDKCEHLAVEIRKNKNQFWQYNINNEYPNYDQKTIDYSTANYIDGETHNIVIESNPTQTTITVKIQIDDDVLFDGEISSTKLYCNSVLTIGAYGTSLVSDAINISSVKVTQTADEPEKEKDTTNLLYDSTLWSDPSSDKVTYDSEAGTILLSGFDGGINGIEYSEILPSSCVITTKIEMKFGETTPSGNKCMGMRFVLLEKDPDNAINALNDESTYDCVYVQIDTNGNCWIIERKDGVETTINGDWMASLKSGINPFTIKIEPYFSDDEQCIDIVCISGGKTCGASIDDLDYMKNNRLVIGGYNPSTSIVDFEVSYVKISDNYTSDPIDITNDATQWSLTGSTRSTDCINNPGTAYATTTALPKIGEISFDFTGVRTEDDEYTTWTRLVLATFKATATNTDYDAESNKGAVVITLGGGNFYTIEYYDGINEVVRYKKATGDATNIINNKTYHFRFVTEKVEEGVKLSIYRDELLEVETTFTEGVFVNADNLYLSTRNTGGKGSTILSNVTYLDAEKNSLIDLIKSIFQLDIITESNLELVKAEAVKLKSEVDNLTDEQLELVDNIMYLEIVLDKIEALELNIELGKVDSNVSIDESNISELKDNLNNLKEKYNNLSTKQKGYITNYENVEKLDVKIQNYEQNLLDKEEAKKVDTLINNIVVPTEYTESNLTNFKKDVNYANEAYEKLTKTQKSYVENYKKIKNYKNIIADYDTANEVVELIKNISIPATIDETNVEALKKDIENCTTEYNNLTDDQKEYVSNYSIIEDTLKKISEYEELVEQQKAKDEKGSIEDTISDITEKIGCSSSINYSIISLMLCFALIICLVSNKKKKYN